MDSLTQIILGAAVGEAVLGRKIGNRAMVWGGIAGTLPDLDVLSGLVTDPMSALAYHRAFTHSLPFALLAAPLVAAVVYRIHGGRLGGLRATIFYPLAALVFWGLLTVGSYWMPLEVYRIPLIALVITLAFAGMCGLAGGWLMRRRAGRVRIPVNAGYAQWTLLFFLAIVTHPLLDCFTAYGTQFFEPLSRLRIAWNTISVVDPLYTLPFLLFLVAASRSRAGSQVRSRWNTLGLLVSSAYLLVTVVNHHRVGTILEGTLTERHIEASGTLHSPSLGNNLLWSGTARVSGTDDYYVGQYSLLDRQARFVPFFPVAGRHDFLDPYAGDRELDILLWFTNGYYTVVPVDSGRVQLSDLRYGLLSDDPTDPAAYLFSWTIDTTVRPVRVLRQQAGPQGDRGEMLRGMWKRMWGR